MGVRLPAPSSPSGLDTLCPSWGHPSTGAHVMLGPAFWAAPLSCWCWNPDIMLIVCIRQEKNLIQRIICKKMQAIRQKSLIVTLGWVVGSHYSLSQGNCSTPPPKSICSWTLPGVTVMLSLLYSVYSFIILKWFLMFLSRLQQKQKAFLWGPFPKSLNPHIPPSCSSASPNTSAAPAHYNAELCIS